MNSIDARERPRLVRGHGCWFSDSSQKEILNLSASAMGLPLGYGANLVRSAVLQVLETNVPGIAGCNVEHDICCHLAEILARFRPPYYDREAFLFASSDQALSAAFQIAREHTSRRRIIQVSSSTHGRDMQQVSYGSGIINGGDVPLHQDGVIDVPMPGTPGSPIRDSDGFLSYLREFVFKCVAHPYEIAALVVSPVGFSDTISIPPDDFFSKVGKLCFQQGILLTVDETRLGIGVLGKRFASDLWDFQPDILCLGEGCANGLAFGATIVMKSFLDFDLCLLDGRSYSQSISCAVVSAILKQSESTFTSNARRIEALLEQQLNRLAESSELVEGVSGKGVLWSVSLADRQATSLCCLTLRDEVSERVQKKGVFMARTGKRSLAIAPPLTASDSELEQGISALEDVLAELS